MKGFSGLTLIPNLVKPKSGETRCVDFLENGLPYPAFVFLLKTSTDAGQQVEFRPAGPCNGSLNPEPQIIGFMFWLKLNPNSLRRWATAWDLLS